VVDRDSLGASLFRINQPDNDGGWMLGVYICSLRITIFVYCVGKEKSSMIIPIGVLRVGLIATCVEASATKNRVM
jgi:hypothetical protein